MSTAQTQYSPVYFDNIITSRNGTHPQQYKHPRYISMECISKSYDDISFGDFWFLGSSHRDKSVGPVRGTTYSV